MTEADGGPLRVVLEGANRHDTKLLAQTLGAIVVDRPVPPKEKPQHLCLDKGYDNPPGRKAADAFGYPNPARRIGEEKLDPDREKTHPARRGVVERTISGLNSCRGLLIRYEKHDWNYMGMIPLACALLGYRRSQRLST